jgi:hypothetical protein
MNAPHRINWCVVLLVTLVLGCEPAFTELAPAQKVEVAMALFPNNGRRGETMTLIALPSVASPTEGGTIEVVGYQSGGGVEVQRVVTEGGTGCANVRVLDVLRFLGETTEDRFPVCIEVLIAPDAPIGDAQLVVELVSEGEDIVGRATFSVLPALNNQPG